MRVVTVGGFGSVNDSVARAMRPHGLNGLPAPRREA
jgi:hypothetical protein